jgi:hypothetical protein
VSRKGVAKSKEAGSEEPARPGGTMVDRQVPGSRYRTLLCCRAATPVTDCGCVQPHEYAIDSANSVWRP